MSGAGRCCVQEVQSNLRGRVGNCCGLYSICRGRYSLGDLGPSPAVSELGLKILVLTSALFAITAVVKNRLIERNLKEEQARRVSKYRRMYGSM